MAFLYVIIAGMMIPIQAALNAQLKNAFGHVAFSVMASLVVSATAMVLYVWVMRLTPTAPAEWTRAPWWAWLGGVCGAFLLIATTTMAPRLGAAALIACVIGGQVFCSLVLDQFGWLGFAHHGLSAGRFLGVALLSTGIYFILRF